MVTVTPSFTVTAGVRAPSTLTLSVTDDYVYMKGGNYTFNLLVKCVSSTAVPSGTGGAAPSFIRYTSPDITVTDVSVPSLGDECVAVPGRRAMLGRRQWLLPIVSNTACVGLDIQVARTGRRCRFSRNPL